MTNRTTFAVFVVFLGPLILADAYGVASLTVNAVVISLAAILVLSIQANVGTQLSSWLINSVSQENHPIGPLKQMTLRVSSAAAGYSYSREEIANILATDFAARSEGSLHPGGHSIREGRERLKNLAAGNHSLAEVFDKHPQAAPTRFRLGRKEEASEYLVGLEAAIRLVRGNE